MPGWHAKTRGLVAEGKLAVAGIAPEQHGDRLALFLQWKQMEEMPVLLDSYNLLGLKAVPTTLLIDEAGVIRFRNPKDAELTAFLALPAADPQSARPAPRPQAVVPGTAQWAVAGALRPGPDVIGGLRKHLADHPGDATAHFQLGVAFRKRHDSGERQRDDFQRAVEHWKAALRIDPGNYIWRRRLQQYGPRLDKPYSFYDWINQAREELRARGSEPHPLVAEPSGAEFAQPLEPGAAQGGGQASQPHPDPDGRLPGDDDGLVDIGATVVAHTAGDQGALRVHLEVGPARSKAEPRWHWNDEAGLSTVHVTAPAGWTAFPATLSLAPREGSGPAASAPRRVEFELRHSGEGPPAARCRIEVFPQVCSKADGECLLLRKDLELPLRQE